MMIRQHCKGELSRNLCDYIENINNNHLNQKQFSNNASRNDDNILVNSSSNVRNNNNNNNNSCSLKNQTKKRSTTTRVIIQKRPTNTAYYSSIYRLRNQSTSSTSLPYIVKLSLLIVLLLLLQFTAQQPNDEIWLLSYLSSILIPLDFYVDATSYSIMLNAKDTDCYTFRIPKQPVTISGNFDCYEEGNTFVRSCRHVEAWIVSLPFPIEHHDHHNPKHSPYVWESQEGNTEEVFHIEVNTDPNNLKNKYQLCFETSNKDDDEIEEHEDDDNIPNSIRIGFHLRIKNTSKERRTLPDNELGPDEQRALHVIDTASSTEQYWHNLLDHFEYMRNRESIQRTLLQQTSDRVIGWSLVEAILVIAMAIAQVCYWKSFFEQRRYL